MSANEEVRVLITGITGMVGSHLLDYLSLNTNWSIYGMARWRSPLDNIFSHFENANSGEKGSLNLVYGDLNDPISLDHVLKVSRPDYIFHLAAQSFPMTSFSSPIDTLQTNIIGTAALLELAVKNVPKSIVHVCSSSEIFGRVPSDRIPISENENFHPASPYAISKAGVDLLGRYYSEAYGLNTQTTRMFTHTGPRRGDVFAESSFAKQIALAEIGVIEPVIKVGNLESLRTIADVRDAVRAYFMLVTQNPIPGSFYNIGGNYTCRIGDILDTLLNLSDVKDFKVVEDPNRLRPIDADLQVPDISKFTKHTNWKPEIPYSQTMQDLLEYWRVKVRIPGNSFVR